ncbi:starch phosphorylase [Olsenella profusa DSM 13989]|uniref:Alpha-1,4 glucan phosphorylase n=1 Tax=Olsenella profusa F0195 TaxID=1125712 RepID=U2TVQ5_9ACTN|nr:glycogen/starch/alpha-glucan phosphorylase [Olsenella profusa]ERL10405.1 phosphorylase, glycogen/starch/alpha-glucan family [Olsenella profusa F0195]MDP9858892.1 starch phosphorylase [Olsenella profusa DSM 13989]
MSETFFKDKDDFIAQYRDSCRKMLGKRYEDLNERDRYFVLASLIAHKARDLRSSAADLKDEKQVYYFSIEFLLGPLLDNYLLNLGIRDVVKAGCRELGTPLDELEQREVDPGLGNGGLGRLAACFLDSMAAVGINGHGNGMRYRYGLFRQEIDHGRQVEKMDNWLENGFSWEARKGESSVLVRFGGNVVRHEDDGRYWFETEGGQIVKAVPYDVPIVGYGGDKVNNLRIWSAEPASEDFDLQAFNNGDYAQAMRFRADVEAISQILYPNDAGEHGRLLRLKQEYLFVSAGLQTVLRDFERAHGKDDWSELPTYVAIHTNDTHPAMCGPELMRILVDERGIDFDEAFQIASACISYTNHTIMPEALEKWPIDMFRNLLPRLYMLIEEIDHRYRDTFPHDRDNWQDLLAETAILWDGQVRMANLSVIFAHSVNGVSALHTGILEDTTLHGFYELTPEKFNNKTNGISHRRFLGNSNPPYGKLITDTIGDGWLKDATQLSRLGQYEDDPSFQEEFAKARQWNKERLASYVKRTSGVELDCSMVFDVQVKRFHAYKRQLLNIMKVMDLRNRLLDDPSLEVRPTAFVFSGKAAQSYTFAKEVIRLINAVADVVNKDGRVNDRIRVAFVPNFAVSSAQLIYPAADISEQISWAGSEASGTSNMKLMMNGAITLGTYDGANVEIAKLVGEDSIKIFGLRTEEVDALRASGTWFAWDVYNKDHERLGRIIDQLNDGTFAELSGSFQSVHDELMMSNDHDLVLADFYSYVKAWEELVQTYGDRRSWIRASIHNTAQSGFFSSDRTVREYNSEIWHA